MQKWEIAGISFLPVVECVMAINAAAGIDGQPWIAESLLLRIFAAVATLAALVRAVLAQRKVAS
jgi:hypothetical protein